MKKRFYAPVLLAMTLVAGLALAPVAAHADRDDYQRHFDRDDYHEHVMRDQGNYDRDHDRDHDVRWSAPEQQRFIFRDEDRHVVHDYMAHHRYHCPAGGCGHVVYYRPGTYLPRDVYYEPLPRDVLVRLAPAPAGTYYVRSGDNAYLVDQATREIIDGISLLTSR